MEHQKILAVLSVSRRCLVSLVLLLVLHLGAGVLCAAQTSRMTLAECVRLAVRENRTIKNAYLDRVVQRYSLRVAEDKFTPKLTLTPEITITGGSDKTVTGAIARATTIASTASGGVTEMLPTGATVNLTGNYGLTDPNNAGAARAYGWNIDLTQPLLKGAGVDVAMASVRTARLTEQGNILSLKSTLMDTVSSVATAYRAYVQAIKSLEITRQSLQRSRDLLETNRELITAGRMAAIEIVQSEADVARQEFGLLSAENAVDAARLALTKAIDIDKNSQIEPVAETAIPPLPFSFAEARKLAFANRSDYQTSLLNHEIAKINLETAKNSVLWDLSLTGGYGETYNRDGNPANDASSNDWRTGLKLSIPIGDLTIRQNLLSQEIGLKKMENDMARQRENIEIEVRDALRTAEMNLRQIKLATQSRVLSEKKVEIETEKLKAGRSTNFQLVSYQNDLKNAQDSELAAIITYLNALTSLEKTLGITLDRWKIALVQR